MLTGDRRSPTQICYLVISSEQKDLITMGRPLGSPNKDKPFRDALRMEAALAANGEASPAHPGSLRLIARKLLERACDDTTSAREVADRLDGKPAQAIEHSGGVSSYDLTKLSDDELDRLEGIVRAMSATESIEAEPSELG